MKWLNKIFGNIFKKEEPDPMKYLIVGIGNMGDEYDETRHNVGFEILDKLAKEQEVSFKSAMLGDIAQFKHKGRTFILLKPSTYVNLSGKAVRHWATKEKIITTNLLIVLDDLNLDFGVVRIKPKGSDGGHNGLKSIDQAFGTNKYARLRFGIGKNFPRGRQVEHVLGKWNNDEYSELPELLQKSADIVKSFGAIGLTHTMNQFNK